MHAAKKYRVAPFVKEPYALAVEVKGGEGRGGRAGRRCLDGPPKPGMRPLILRPGSEGADAHPPSVIATVIS